jgi:hypothetical protein
LSLHGFTGALHLDEGDRKGILYLQAGRIQGAVSSPNPNPIGKRLLEQGMVNAKDLEKALESQKKDHSTHPLGHYLVDVLKVVSAVNFKTVLGQQTLEIVNQLLRLETGHFNFEDGVLGFRDYPIQSGTESLILNSFRALSPARASDALPPGSAILEWAPHPPAGNLDLSFTSQEWNTLILFGGERNLDDVLKMAPDEPLRPVVVVHGLISAGLLKKIRFRFPDLEKIAQETLGNMGLVLVQNSYQQTGVSRARMGMRELVRILNDLEKSMTLIVDPTRSSEITEQMWETVKR